MRAPVEQETEQQKFQRDVKDLVDNEGVTAGAAYWMVQQRNAAAAPKPKAKGNAVGGTNLGNRPLGLQSQLDDYEEQNVYDRRVPDLVVGNTTVVEKAMDPKRSGQMTADMLGISQPGDLQTAGFSPTLAAAGAIGSNPLTEKFVVTPALAALQAADKVWENVIAEPAAAIWLAPTYALSNMSDGLQFSDVGDALSKAWENKNYISFGQAVVASPFARGVGGLGMAFGLTADDNSGLDLSTREGVYYAQQNLMGYSLLTGTFDAGLNMAPIPVGKGVGAARRVLGLSNEVTQADRVIMKADIAAQKLFDATGGAQGYETNLGKQVKAATESQDGQLIRRLPIVEKQGGAAKYRLSHLYRLSNDYDLNADLFLMSVGDVEAAGRVVASHPHIAYAYGNMGKSLAAAVAKGTLPDGDQAKLLERAFDSTIESDEWASGVAKTFFHTEDGTPQEFAALGYWKPMEGRAPNQTMLTRVMDPVATKVAKTVEGSRVGAGRTRAAFESSNMTYLPKMVSKIIQTTPDGPKIRLLKFPVNSAQWAVSRTPLEVITFSGTRPDDVIEEYIAKVEQISGMRVGEEFPIGFYTENGAERILYKSATEMRADHVERLSAAMVRGEGAVLNEWRRIEKEMFDGLALKYGMTKEMADETYAIVMERAGQQWQTLKNKGYFFNEVEEQVRFGETIDTIAQLADHDFVLPLNQIEEAMKAHKDIIAHGVRTFKDVANTSFNVVGAIWRTDMLLKPGYTFRNSMMEPAVSMFIAQADAILTGRGLVETVTGVKNFGKNNVRRTKRVTAGAVDRKKSSALAEEFRGLALSYYRLLGQRNKLASEVRDYADGGPPSVAAKKAEAETELELVNRQLVMLKGDLSNRGLDVTTLPDFDVTSTHREIDDMLSIVDDPIGSEAIAKVQKSLDDAVAAGAEQDVIDGISDRLTILKELEAKILAGGPEADDLRKSLAKIKAEMKSVDKALAHDPTVDFYKMDEIEKIEWNLRSVEEQQIINRLEHSVIKDRREERAKVIIQGRGRKTVKIRGQEVEFRELAEGRKGDAFLDEASSGQTALQTYAPGLNNNAVGLLASSRHSRAATATINAQDPNYFEEVHYFAQRYFSDDAFFQQILKSDLDDVDDLKVALVEWAKGEGSWYFNAMGKRGKEYIDSDMDEAIDLVRALFPTKEARALVSSRTDFTSGELAEAMLAAMPDGSTATFANIIGERIDHLVPSAPINTIAQGGKNILSTLWSYIAVQPETRMARWPFYRRQFETEWKKRVEMLADQGVEITPAVANAQRQAARRDSLAQLEKTFYNIRRYNNSVYALRFVSSFPGAFFNSIYRYAYYLPSQHPGNFVATVNMANASLGAFSVNEAGEEVPFGEADYLLIPGTAEPEDGDMGVRIPLDAITRVFLDNPSRSWLVAMAVDPILNARPDLMDFLDKHAPKYVRDFIATEYGPQQGDIIDVATGTLQSGWMKTLQMWWRGEGSQEYLTSYAWAYQDTQAQLERQGEFRAPTREEVLSKVNGWMGTRLMSQFFSPIAYKQDAPGQYERDLYYKLREENPDLSFDDLKELYYSKVGGEWADPYTASTSVNTYGLSGDYSMESWELLQENADLANELEKIDPKLVGLVVAGINGTFSRAVYNNIRQNGPFPGADVAGSKKTPDDLEREYVIDEGWAQYSANRERYLLEVEVAKAAEDPARRKRLDEQWWFFLNNTDESAGTLGLMVRNPLWAGQMNGGNRDTTALIANGLQLVVDDEKFMADRKGDRNWSLINMLLVNRQAVKSAIHYAETKEEKDALKYQYTAAMETYAAEPENRTFRDLWDRYFAEEYAVEVSNG